VDVPHTQQDIEDQQRAVCRQNRAGFFASPDASILGIAASTRGRRPANGLRHTPAANTCGWYIWFGEEFSEAADFFVPVHVAHLHQESPELIRLLGLPPGYRFLLADDYLDVWFDPELLNT
jgi:hypothetical protein